MFDAQKLLKNVLGGGGASGALKGAALGGLASVLLGSKSGRKLAGTALKAGGVAALGGLAYTAWKNWQAQQGGGAGGTNADTAEGTVFLPGPEAERNDLGMTLLSAMIAAAKADGHLDADEQARIFAKADETSLSSEEKGFLMDQMRNPASISSLTVKATSPERAAEIYTAARLAIDPDHAAEKDYLDRLAAALSVAPGLKAAIDHEVTAKA